MRVFYISWVFVGENGLNQDSILGETRISSGPGSDGPGSDRSIRVAVGIWGRFLVTMAGVTTVRPPLSAVSAKNLHRPLGGNLTSGFANRTFVVPKAPHANMKRRFWLIY